MTVDRAQLALAEIHTRQQADAAEQARSIEAPPDEDERRAELTRWNEQDQGDDAADTGRGSGPGDGSSLER